MYQPTGIAPPGGEAVRHVKARALRVIRILVDVHRSAAIVAVSHEMPIRLVLASILGRTRDDVWRFEIPSGSITRMEKADSGFRLIDLPGTY